jgi:ribonucleoside-diphosphate reductase alpha chain
MKTLGIVWMERYNKESNSWYFSPIVATNPCGEQGLPEWGVCNLGHLVLPRFYSESGAIFDRVSDKSDILFYPQWHDLAQYSVNWDDLARAVRAGVRLQDNIIDYTQYFLKENEEVQLKERRVGMGSMGLGTLMIQLKLRYGSEEGNEFLDILYKFIAYHGYNASMDYSGEKGSFPAYEYKLHIQSGFMKTLLGEFSDLAEKLKEKGIRNVTILTQAPTGSTATYIDNIPLFRVLFGGSSTGIEPYFGWEFWRASRLGFAKQVTYIAQKALDELGLESVDQLPSWFVTAQDLSAEDHVRVQGAVQKWTDSSISKTANAPKDFTIEETDKLYMLSYDLGLKGMTIYRDGCRDAQVLATNKEDAKLEFHIEAEALKKMEQDEIDKLAENDTEDVEYPMFEIKKRPKRLHGFTDKVNFMYGDKMGKAYVTVNSHEGEVFEVIIQTKVKEISAIAKALGLMTTKLLRLGGASDNLQQAIDTLTYDQTMGTLPYVIANILKGIQKDQLQSAIPSVKNIEELSRQEDSVVLQSNSKVKREMFTICSECGTNAYDKVNCICNACGQSKCN